MSLQSKAAVELGGIVSTHRAGNYEKYEKKWGRTYQMEEVDGKVSE
jgi:hypothetical protein